jgi:hypothetical protein
MNRQDAEDAKKRSESWRSWRFECAEIEDTRYAVDADKDASMPDAAVTPPASAVTPAATQNQAGETPDAAAAGAAGCGAGAGTVSFRGGGTTAGAAPAGCSGGAGCTAIGADRLHLHARAGRDDDVAALELALDGELD